MNKGHSMTGLARVRHFVAVLLGILVLLANARAQGAAAPTARTVVVTAARTMARPVAINNRTSHTMRAPIPFEVRWLQTNINLHNRLIKQTQFEAVVTTNTTLKTFAADLKTTLSLEVAQMQGWLKDWYGITPPATPAGPAMPRDPVVTALTSQDLLYLNQVICYEHSMIQLSIFAASKATHAELKAFAKKSVVNGQNVLTLANAWQDLLIKIVLEQYFKE